MPIFIKIPKKERTNLFYLTKEKLGLSFNEMYPRFNISRAMFYNYLAGRYDIPKKIVDRLEKISKITIKNYKKIKKEKYLEKEITQPKLNESLAEIFGILNGDGHMSKINHEICVVTSTLEKDYLIYLKKLFKKTLKLNFRIYIQDTKAKVRANSK